MKRSPSSFLKRCISKSGMLASLLLPVLLTACTTVAPSYQPTIDNVKTLQMMPGSASAEVGDFTLADESMNRLTIRASVYTSPFKGSFAEYIKEALRSELDSAGKLGNKNKAVISGHLLKNYLDGSLGTGTASVTVRFTVKRDGKLAYEKVINGETKWDSPFIGAIAIPEAQRNHTEAVKQVLGKLFADADFRRAIE